MKPAVYIPSQTNIGLEVWLPTEADAKKLEQVLQRFRRGRTRIAKNYSTKGIELHWIPTPMPALSQSREVIARWARQQGFSLARDVREFKNALEALRTVHRVVKAYAIRQGLLDLRIEVHATVNDLALWFRGFDAVLADAKLQAKADGILEEGQIWAKDLTRFAQQFDDLFPQVQELRVDLPKMFARCPDLTEVMERYEFRDSELVYSLPVLLKWAAAFKKWLVNATKALAF